MSQFSSSGGQSIGASALALVLPMNIQSWLLIGLISLQSKILKPSPVQFESIISLVLNLLYGPTLTWLLEKP